MYVGVWMWVCERDSVTVVAFIIMVIIMVIIIVSSRGGSVIHSTSFIFIQQHVGITHIHHQSNPRSDP